MVCIMEEDESAVCVVRDFSGTSQDWKIETLVTASTTGKQFLREIADRYNFEPDSFRLVSPTPYKKNNVYQAVITQDTEETLKEIGINFESGSRNLFIVEGLDGQNPRLVSKHDDLELGASASPEEPSSSNSSSPPCLTNIPETGTGYSSYRFVTPKKDSCRLQRRKQRLSLSESIDSPSGVEYRGLVNQAMTCYLNSLLQALFMTPEFRNALYNWRFVPTCGMDESKSIPYQLQRLFLNLQTSPRDSVETTELTRSFGWDSSEAWQQHDIQELCRVMFDALEQEFKGTEQADLINGLYQGKMIDYVECLECGTEKSREDTFLDIPLPVRPFGSSTAYGSVEEALRAFVQPEVLEGNNQYFCEKCNKKCNAHKGLKFTKFPYLLTLHLMRFDFDYSTMHRIKLSDKVSFPQTLNLNSLIPYSNVVSSTSPLYKEEGSEGFPEEITGSSSKCDDSSTTDSGSAIDDEGCMASSNDNVDYDQDVDEGIDVSNQIENEKNRLNNEAGPYVYELFSVMVHSGSASGGHYYAYIKDFETGDWYCFNDQSVHKITSEQIESSFGVYGPSRGYYSGVYSSSMNAYMLMYRQIDKERNVLPLKEDRFPAHIKTLLKEMNENANNYRQMKEKERELVRLKIYFHQPATDKRIDCRLDCEAHETLKEVVKKAYKKLQLETTTPLDYCRLVVYNSQDDTIERSLEGKDHEEIGNIFFKKHIAWNYKKQEMLLEIRPKDKPFPVYKPGCISLKLSLVHIDKNQIDNAIVLRTNLLNKVKEFKEELYQHFNFDPLVYYLLIMLEVKGNAVKFIDDDEAQLKDCGEFPNSKVFVCFQTNATDMPTKYRIAMRKLVLQYLNVIKLNVLLPDIKPDILKKWSIPTLSEYNSINHKYNEENQPTKKINKEPYDDLEVTANNVAAQYNGFSSASAVPAASNGDEVYSNEISMPNSNAAGAMNIGGHHSDQSASEDSSLTDSDRTIIGDTQEEYQMSSSGSSPRGGGGDFRQRSMNDLVAEDDHCSDIWDRHSDSLDNNDVCHNENEFYFKEIHNSVTFNKKKNLKLEVDKRTPVDVFKKNLEQYVQTPSVFFKISPYANIQDEQGYMSRMDISSLEKLENDATLHIRLNPIMKPNTPRVKLSLLDYKANRIENYIDDIPIFEDKSVGETKKYLVHYLRWVQNIDMDFESCRLHVISGGIRRVCLNDEIWASLKLKNDWQLYIQRLYSDETITDAEKQIDIPIRRYHPATRSYDSIEEIILEDFTIDALKSKISEISSIPEENLIISLQEITQRTNVSSIEWSSVMNISSLHKSQNSLREINHLVNYKDGREDSNDDSSDRKGVKKVLRREKPLRIVVAEKTSCNGENSNSTASS
ncbi:ubiquitin carboxyl-terminal hydrolase 47-like isoform X2 [Planococcus citri]|uniref:ubiquitin carboxyl-terminal hydrolase 47-like isoform X2 n=1 Tax=Planococcus citri TaxID=170843 RepID=UPI0031F88E4E